MRHRSVAAAFRLAEFYGDDRLAGGARHAARRLEFIDIGDRLDIDDDDFQLGLVGEKGDVVGDAEAGFVAAGDEVFGIHAALLERGVQENHHAAALADQRHRPLAQQQGAVLAERDEAGLGADIAHAIGAGHRQPGLGDHRFKLAAERRSVGVVGFAKARGKHRGAARAGGSAAAQHLRHARRRHQYDEMVGRFRQRREVGITAVAADFRPSRIDQIKRPRKLVLLEIAQDAPRPASRPVVGADQHRIARLGQCLHFFLRCFEIHVPFST